MNKNALWFILAVIVGWLWVYIMINGFIVLNNIGN